MATKSPLDAAREAAKKRAQEQAVPDPQIPDDLDGVECLVQLLVQSYALGITYGMGAMQDGSALWCRVRVPKSSTHPCAGMVAFVVDTDPTAMLRKALVAMESSPASKWWKMDQYA